MTRNAILVFRSNLEVEKEDQRKSTQHDIELDLSHVVFNVGGKRFVVDASNWDLEGAMQNLSLLYVLLNGGQVLDSWRSCSKTRSLSNFRPEDRFSWTATLTTSK